MARYKGKSTLHQVYNINDYHPLDTRMLVPTYNDLLLEDNWLYNGESNAYNGMIVAVGGNTSDISKNGVYYLFDASNPRADDIPDVTKEASWHKLADQSELAAFATRFSEFAEVLASLDARLTALEEDSDVVTYGYRKDFPEAGEEGKLYIATDEHKSYVWIDNAGYLCVGEENHEIVEINGGTAD